ncbi:alkaline phosphatase [Roseiconus nitratireducens]|uniref:Alkaline phosphatase n=1 Tax=Roseiconus nitratireducens TaxID=2605748 RepID=A0A5M6D0X1_9BACT|nr:alkaline phosphatase [Roseiconus nitratireducens]
MTLDRLRERGSAYADQQRLDKLTGQSNNDAFNPIALYFDQTAVYDLQQAAVDAGYSNIIVMVFDGMDWNTTRAASIYKTGNADQPSGRGSGLAFQDDRRAITDFGFVCTSAAAGGARTDVDAQTVLSVNEGTHSGFDVRLGGTAPWHERTGSPYLLGKDRSRAHTVTDSASSATSLFSGIKTYNGAINVDVEGNQVQPIARQLQAEQDFMIGVVTSVPVSHATPAAAYANNVSRKDYQDISRDLVGLPSAAHREPPLPGVDVLIGGGWGEGKQADKVQGRNFAQGNPYFHQDDLRASDLKHGGRYRVAQRTKGKSGRDLLLETAQQAADHGERLLGFFGTKGGHLPFATADGDFQPTIDVKNAERYSPEDVRENPTLADMTEAALLVLEQSIDGFWLMVEAGDVDWANHSNNLDNSIGAVLSGEQAFRVVMDWVDRNNAWDHTAVILTADHGHYLVIDHPEEIASAGRTARSKKRSDDAAPVQEP